MAACFSELVIKYRSPFEKRRDLLEKLRSQAPLVSLTIRSIVDYLDGRLTAENRADKMRKLDSLNSKNRTYDKESIQTEEPESTLHFVSRPPTWCQEVCAILNKKANNDWRAVAQKLEYRYG